MCWLLLFADLCAADAKKTTPCIVAKGSASALCPKLLSGVSCSSLTGESPTVFPGKHKQAVLLQTAIQILLKVIISILNPAGSTQNPVGSGQHSRMFMLNFVFADSSGSCSGEELCSAKPPVMDIYAANAINIDNQDATAGMCVVPKGAGSPCAAGSGKIYSWICVGYVFCFVYNAQSKLRYYESLCRSVQWIWNKLAEPVLLSNTLSISQTRRSLLRF